MPFPLGPMFSFPRVLLSRHSQPFSECVYFFRLGKGCILLSYEAVLSSSYTLQASFQVISRKWTIVHFPSLLQRVLRSVKCPSLLLGYPQVCCLISECLEISFSPWFVIQFLSDFNMANSRDTVPLMSESTGQSGRLPWWEFAGTFAKQVEWVLGGPSWLWLAAACNSQKNNGLSSEPSSAGSLKIFLCKLIC